MSRAFVIGAGIGGLTAAWRLQQAGCEVEVFERETLDLIAELGLESELQAIRGKAAIPRDGRLHLIEMDAPLKALFTSVVTWRSKLALIKLLGKFWQSKAAFSFLSLGGARGQDTETLAEYCQRSFPPEVYTYLLNPALKFLYLHNGQSGSLIELLWWMSAGGSGKPRSLRRGSSSLTDALASRLKVHVDSEVTQISRDGDGVRIEVKQANGELRSHQADVCIVTVPGTISAEICKDGLSANQREFLRSRRYDLSIVVSFRTQTRPALDALMFMLPDEASADLATIIFGHNIGPERAPAGQGIVNAYFMKQWSEQHQHEPDEAVMLAAQAQIKTWVPEVQNLVAWNVQRWPYSAAITEPGDCARIQAFEDEVDPSSPIQIIGDFQAQASMNVAVANANRVVARLVASRRA